MLIFYSLFPQCGAWFQDNFHVTSIHVDRIASFVLGEDQVQGRGHFVKRLLAILQTQNTWFFLHFGGGLGEWEEKAKDNLA